MEENRQILMSAVTVIGVFRSTSPHQPDLEKQMGRGRRGEGETAVLIDVANLSTSRASGLK